MAVAAASQDKLAPQAAAGFAALLLGIGIGRFAYPPLIPVLVLHHWFLPAAADYLASVNLVGYILGAVLGARLGHAKPVGPWVRAAMLAVVLSYALCAWPWGFLWFAWWRLAAGVAAGLLMVLAIPTLLSRAPEARRGWVSGIMFTGIGAGEVLAGAAVPALAAHSLAAAWLGMGAFAAVVAAIAWPYWHSRSHPADTATPAIAGSMPIGAGLLKLFAAYGLAAFAFAPISLFWVDFLARGLGLGPVRAGHFWSLFGLAAIAGPLVAGAIAGHTRLRWNLAGWYALVAATALLPLRASAVWALVAASVLLGCFGPAITSLSSGRTLELVPAGWQKRAWGYMTAVFSISYAASAGLMTAIFARTGSYRWPFALAWAALALAAALAAA